MLQVLVSVLPLMRNVVALYSPEFCRNVYKTSAQSLYISSLLGTRLTRWAATDMRRIQNRGVEEDDTKGN